MLTAFTSKKEKLTRALKKRNKTQPNNPFIYISIGLGEGNIIYPLRSWVRLSSLWFYLIWPRESLILFCNGLAFNIISPTIIIIFQLAFCFIRN